MKRFLFHSIYFTFIFIVINFMMYYWLVKPAVFDKYIYNDADVSSYNYLLVSDSHGAYLRNSVNFNGIFNASYISDNYHDALLKIKYFSGRMPENSAVILSIDNHQFSEYRDGAGNIGKTNIYAQNFESIKEVYGHRDFFINKYMKWLPILNPEYNEMIDEYVSIKINTKKEPISIKGITSENLMKAVVNRVEYQFKKSTKSQQQLLDLIKIIKFCKKNKIRLFCVKFPVTKEYWSLVKQYKYEISEMLKEKDVEVIDLHDLFFNQNSYFRDQDHMNFDGGVEFSKVLRQRMK